MVSEVPVELDGGPAVVDSRVIVVHGDSLLRVEHSAVEGVIVSLERSDEGELVTRRFI